MKTSEEIMKAIIEYGDYREREGMAKQSMPETAAVIQAAISWWRGKRPSSWSEQDHFDSPTINAHETERSERLAQAVADLVSKETGESNDKQA